MRVIVGLNLIIGLLQVLFVWVDIALGIVFAMAYLAYLSACRPHMRNIPTFVPVAFFTYGVALGGIGLFILVLLGGF